MRVLTTTGGIAAVIVGTLIFGSGGWPDAVVLFTFFFSSVLLSRAGRERKRKLIDVGKTGARDGSQVAANGLVATFCAMMALSGSALWQVAFVAAFAAAAADTWATEIGTLAAKPPRSILTGKPLAPGISGGVTVLGTFAAAGGAIAIALVARFSHASAAFAAIAIGGFAGALVDSFLGATVQALRYCAGCGRYCETDPHACGADTSLVRGAAWMNNDGVNFLATASGASVAAGLCYFFPNFFSR